jgi:hypothetical protein
MNDTPTPRTDEMREAYVNFQHGKYTVDVGDVFDFARKLERELTAMTEQRDEARIELEKYTTDSEDDALYNVRRLRKELTAVTEQRDEALNQLRKAQVENDHNWQAMELYESEREQRDRLAEALQMINSACQGEGWTISELRACCSSHCNEALQSITPNEL